MLSFLGKSPRGAVASVMDAMRCKMGPRTKIEGASSFLDMPSVRDTSERAAKKWTRVLRRSAFGLCLRFSSCNDLDGFAKILRKCEDMGNTNENTAEDVGNIQKRTRGFFF